VNPTPDTPQQRDAKADTIKTQSQDRAARLKDEEEITAAKLAADLRRFRREMRLLWATTIVIALIGTLK
jgi:hypothetical protein